MVKVDGLASETPTWLREFGVDGNRQGRPPKSIISALFKVGDRYRATCDDVGDCVTEISALVDRLIGRGENERERSPELVGVLADLLYSKDESEEELTAQELHDVHEFILDDEVCESLFLLNFPHHMRTSDSLFTGSLFEIFELHTPSDEAIISKKNSTNHNVRMFSILAFVEECTGRADDSMAHLCLDPDSDVSFTALTALADVGVSATAITTVIDEYREENGDDEHIQWLFGWFNNFNNGVFTTEFDEWEIYGRDVWLEVSQYFLNLVGSFPIFPERYE